MKSPLIMDYYGDLGLVEPATGDEIEKVYRILEGKYRAEDDEERLQKARDVYGLLSRAPERADYDKDYANARTAWFRHRKWTDWEAAAEKTAARGEGGSPENKNLNYAQKLMAKMRDRRAKRETVIACDLCYNKKIKCDATQPRCSGCKLYNSECTYTGPSRATASNANHLKKIEMLEARLAQLEGQNQQSQTMAQVMQNLAVKPVDISLQSQIYEFDQPWARHAGPSSSNSPASSSTGQDSNICTQEANSRTLPPLRHVLPTIEDYFQNSNQLLPLFEKKTFMNMLRGWYAYPAHRKPDAWAAVNIVLALARRHSYASSFEETQNMQRYINNVQSVLNRLVINEPSLLVLQIILGLVLVFHGSADQGPASIMIATALRLAQTLKLHTNAHDGGFEPDEVLQRTRVFWIAYILDRDLAMRTSQPPIHQDCDIDVDLPSVNPPDGSGLLFGLSGQVFNYFRSRIQLAHIEGKLYYMLRSVRALKLPEHERRQNTLRIRAMLDSWLSAIPADFQPHLVAGTVSAEYLRYLSLMHYTHLQLVATTHHTDSHHMEWMQDILNCSKGQTLAVRSDLAARLPSCWDKLVGQARTCMELYAATPENDSALTWLVSCGYLTSVMFITVNNLARPNNPCRLTDQSNVDSALLLLERLIKATDDDRLKRIHGACKELSEKTRLAVTSHPANDFFNPPGLEFGDEDPLDAGRWDLMNSTFWATQNYGTAT
ncbi:fungal specific transcription factor [Colletotrichum tabaci]|uniref:Fungal specific transcription factor n=1 Tax=Colletotrichum tabaci TaxID=1209068 RepID=A0AAV9T4W2_9PEZI